MRFIDTNVFIRYLTGDDPVKEGASRLLMERLAAGEEEALTSESVVAENIYVLTSRSHYGLTREDAVARLLPAVQARGLRLPDKAVVLRAFDIYATYPFLDFEDALSVAHMASRDVREIVSHDLGFDHVSEVTRVEP